MGKKQKTTFSSNDYFDFLDLETPVLITDDDVNVKIIESLVKSKKWLLSLKSMPLYLACKKESKFNPLGLKPTNLLTKDPTYYKVYNFYLNYLNKEPLLQSEQSMYLGYFTVNLFNALYKFGFKVLDETKKVGITNSGVIRFSQVKFNKNEFTVILSQEENGVLMTVKTPDDNEGKYLFKVITKGESNKIKGFTLSNYAKTLNNSDGVIKTFIVNDIRKSTIKNTLYILPTMVDTTDIILKALKTSFLIGIGSSFMYSKYCPVCGSNLISKSLSGYTCSSCKTLYHVFDYNGKGMVWFKDFKDKTE
jgi:hypothetical protein